MKVAFSRYVSRRLLILVLSSLISAIIGFMVRVFLLYYFNLDALSIEDPLLCIFSLFSLNIFRLAIRSLLENLISEPLSMNIGDIINSDSPITQPSGSSAKPSGSTSGSSKAGGPSRPESSSQAKPSSRIEPSSQAGPLSEVGPSRTGPSRPGPSRSKPAVAGSSVAESSKPKTWENIIPGSSWSRPANAGPESQKVVWTQISTLSKPPKVWQGSGAKYVQELEWRPEAIPASTGLPPARPSNKPGLWSSYPQDWKPAENEFKPLSESLRKEMGPPLFKVTDGKYMITDPNKIAERGYIDPVTKKSYVESSQPFLTNLACALEHEAQSRNLETAKFNWEKFDPQTQKFIKDWMFWNHNSLPLNGAYNCTFVRESMVKHR